jgi:hypothetical protein
MKGKNMQPRRQCYHVSVPLEGKNPVNVYFEPSGVEPKIRQNNAFSEILKSISYQLATSDNTVKDYYISDIQLDQTKTFKVRGVTAGGAFLAKKFPFVDDQGINSNLEISQKELPRNLSRLPLLVEEKKAKEAEKIQQRGREAYLFQQKQAQAEKERRQKEEEAKLKANEEAKAQKILDAEKEKVIRENKLLEIKKLIGINEEKDPIKKTVAAYHTANFKSVLDKQTQEITQLSLGIRQKDEEINEHILIERIKEEQKGHKDTLSQLDTSIQEKLKQYEGEISQIQEEAENYLLNAYDQYDTALKNIYLLPLSKTLNEFIDKNTPLTEDNKYILGEISAAAGLERPKISEKEKVDPDSVKDLYRARVIKHLSEKNVNIEEVQTVIGQIRKIFARPPKRSFINIFQSSPEHPFIKSLDENIKNNLQPNALQGFSPKVVAEGMDERAKKITQMQTLIQGDINQRALAIKEYKEFLEQAKHELAAVENLRGQARILSSPVENHNSELNRLKKEMEELKEKSDTILKDKNSMSQDRQKEVNDSLTALTAAIAKVEALIENNQKTVKNINDKLKHEFITKGEAEKILEEGKEKLEASILEAEKQYQLAQCESFIIRACKLEVSLLQEKSSIKATVKGADKLIEEVREDQRENMKEKRKAILSLIEKIDTTNSANFKAIENFRSTINDPKAGGPTKEDACLKCETLLSTPINQHNNEENPREEQVLLQKIKSEHAQIKLANAQKEFFNMMKTNLSNQIPYWRKQRIIGGKEVNYEGKKIKVPTGIGQMINLLGPSPNYSPHLFKEPKDNKKEFTPKEINEYLKKIQEIASDRQQYRSLNRKTATKEIYKLAESIPSLDMPPATPEEMANQAKQFEQLTQEMQKIQAKYFPSSVPAVDSENKIKPR